MIRVKDGAVSQGECRSSKAKLSWLDACEDWQVVRMGLDWQVVRQVVWIVARMADASMQPGL